MTLTLRIENYDSLPDGGPTFASVTEQGMTVGRSRSMDWSLPDPERHISSHHFDISYSDGVYWLTDVSTNGVFLDGQRHRIEGAHQLSHGERFQVGNYFIKVSIGADPVLHAPAPQAPPLASPPAFDDSDPWAVDSAPVAPIDPNPRPHHDPYADFAGEFIVNPVAAPAAPPQPAPAPVAQPMPAAAPSPFGGTPPAGGGSDSPFGAPPPAGSGLLGGAPAPTPAPGGLQQPPFMMPPAPAQPAAMPAPAPVPVAAHAPAPAAAPAPASGASDAAIIAAFCEGAGIKPPAPGTNANATDLARELGRTMQVAAAELMALLQDRAAAKKFTRGGDRTMMGVTNNNPLKFLPDATQALEVMFIAPRDGFMPGGEGLASALGDVKTHQMAVFAAIQPALLKLLEDLAPEAIEEEASGGLLGGGGRRKAWEEYVKRWDAKVANHENGMLDVFLKHFAESYAAAVAAAQR